jgi:hypothetical protein
VHGLVCDEQLHVLVHLQGCSWFILAGILALYQIPFVFSGAFIRLPDEATFHLWTPN